MRTTNTRIVVYASLAIAALCGLYVAGTYWSAHRGSTAFGQLAAEFERAGMGLPARPDPGRVLALLGEDEGRKFLKDVARKYDAFAFDETSRFARIRPDSVRYSNGSVVFADGLSLNLLLPDGGVRNLQWAGPPRLRIIDLAFIDEGVLITYYLRAEQPRSGTVQGVVPWPAGEVPRPPVGQSWLDSPWSVRSE